jgi:hypothetical protein
MSRRKSVCRSICEPTHTTASRTGKAFVLTGSVLGQTGTAARPAQRQGVYVILDNLSAHKTQSVQEFLTDHPNVSLHFTPTLLLLVEPGRDLVSKIERHVIARGVFSSVNELARKIMRYIRLYNRAPKPTYSDPRHRIRGVKSSVTGN